MTVKITYFVHGTTTDNEKDLAIGWNPGKTVAIVAHQAPQLALEVLLKGKTWQEAIKEDWRNKKEWKPGWNYILRD
jgi:hypothetical protein